MLVKSEFEHPVQNMMHMPIAGNILVDINVARISLRVNVNDIAHRSHTQTSVSSFVKIKVCMGGEVVWFVCVWASRLCC